MVDLTRERLRVLHIEAGKHLYGGAQQVVYLCQGLQNYPVDNILLCPHNSAVATAARPFAQVESIAMNGDLDFGLITRICQKIEQHQPHILHVHSRRGADLFAALAAQKMALPAVCSRRVDNKENAFFARWKYRKYRNVVCISEGIANVVRATGYPDERITTIHSAVDTSLFTADADRAWFRNEFNIQPDELVIANFAQMIERKGQAELIKAFNTLVKHTPNCKLLLFGQGPRLASYQELVRQLGLQSRVFFPGFRKDMARIIPVVDLVVHPAKTEGLGVALLQSAACGRAIVATRTGGIPEIVRQHQNGLLLDVGDHSGLVAAMQKLLSDAVLRDEMGKAGRKIVEQDFSVATMAQRNYLNYLTLL